MPIPNSAQTPSDLSDKHSKIQDPSRTPTWRTSLSRIITKINRIPWAKSHDPAILFIVLVLAAIPPLLVMGDRWLQLFPRDFLNDYWCQSTFLCKSMLPSYFLIIIPCVLGLLILMFFQRHPSDVIQEKKLEVFEKPIIGEKQRRVGWLYLVISFCGFIAVVISSLIKQTFPGWSLVYVWLAFLLGCYLLSVKPEAIVTFWKSQGELWVAMLLVYLSIIGVLVGLYAQPNLFWITALLLVLAVINLWRFRHQVPLIFWIVSLSLVVFTININGWWTAAVGDEFGFYINARDLVENLRYGYWGSLIFSANGVSNAHPYFSSVLQAISMLFFGHENFGWRFSNPFLCSLSVGFVYLFGKSFLSKQVSLIAALLLAVSSYIMSFGKIGYNNLQALFALTLVLAITAWALRQRTILPFACLGSALAFCFYVYPAALYVPPLSILLLAMYYPPKTREIARNWLVVVGVFFALIFPLLVQPVYWETKITGTIYNQPVIVQTSSMLFNHVFYNLLYSLFSFLYISSESHFIASSYLDPISCVFFLIGFSFLVYRIRRDRFALFVMASYLFLIFIVGVSHDRDAPPNTRMFLLLPFYALIAAWGLKWILAYSTRILSIPKRSSLLLTAIFVVSITGLNLYQGYTYSHFRFSHKQEIESLFIRISQYVAEARPNDLITYMVIVDKTWGVTGLQTLQNIYPHFDHTKIDQIVIEKPVLQESDLALLRERNTIVIIMPWLDPVWVNALDEPLKSLDKKRCVISTSGNDPRFILYYPPDLPQACYP